ncbi:MAG TPA: hypothetical protein VHY34_11380 [Caulobacteraceae bacterium]|nr:hypothetical protein [Caulobacteraceae bacterium]
MRIYLLYVHDDRYSVPTLDTIIVRDDERAREIAVARLVGSPHYRCVEVWDESRLVCGIDRPRPSPGQVVSTRGGG